MHTCSNCGKILEAASIKYRITRPGGARVDLCAECAKKENIG